MSGTLKSNDICPKYENNATARGIWVIEQIIITGIIYKYPHSTAESLNYLVNVFREMSMKRKPLFNLKVTNDDLDN